MKIGQRSACVFHDLSAKASGGNQAGHIEAERLPVVDEELWRWPMKLFAGGSDCVLNVNGPSPASMASEYKPLPSLEDGGVILPKVGIGEEAHAGNGVAEIVHHLAGNEGRGVFEETVA